MHQLERLTGLPLAEHSAWAQTLLKWGILGSAVGLLAGVASALFLLLLDAVTHFRGAYPGIVWLLPLAGFGVGWVYQRFAGTAAQGSHLVIEAANTPRITVPRRMAPLVLFGTLVTHLFGGSAGREGTAVQMGASLADALRRLLGLEGEDRRRLVLAGISGGFGSVFGTPLAGLVFALEVGQMGRIRYDGLVACLSAAIMGDLTTRALGAAHSQYPALPHTPPEIGLLAKIMVAGILFGLTSLLFIEFTHAVKRQAGRLRYAPLRPVIGGLIVLALTALMDTPAYNGLSLPLIHASLNPPGDVLPLAFLAKLILTGITLGSGFMGGEVTPLFVIGATLGHTLGGLLGVDAGFLAALGFVAVFAGASNTPLACTLMGIELFGGGSALYLALACFSAYLASGHRSIYTTQGIAVAKADAAPLPPR